MPGSKPTTVPAAPESPPSQASHGLSVAAEHSHSSKPETVPADDPPEQADTGLATADQHLDQFTFPNTVAGASLDALSQDVPDQADQGLAHLPAEIPPATLPEAAHFPADILSSHVGWLFS